MHRLPRHPHPRRTTNAHKWIIACALFIIPVLIALALFYWYQSEINRTEFTTSTTPENIVIGNDALKIPANYFRFKFQRETATPKQVDLAMLWPDGRGYSQKDKAQFKQSRNLIFITIKKRALAHDMNGRLKPVYQQLLEPQPVATLAGLSFYQFKANVGYDREQLAVGQLDEEQWVARCDQQTGAVQSTCLHDMNMGTDLVVLYRLNVKILENWREINALVTKKLNSMIERQEPE